MTTRNAYAADRDIAAASAADLRSGHCRLPDPPEPTPDMTSFNHLSANGNVHHLRHHFGSPDTTLVAGEHYISAAPTRDMAGLRYPDLLIAFGVNPAAYYRSNAYIIAEQGKPPDFVLEIASRSTGGADTGAKRYDYAALGIPEYWRFDETGEHHGARLAGDRLAGGEYHPIRIDEIAEGVLEGYSGALGLNLRWVQGRLEWHDPATGRHIPTFDAERSRADAAQYRADVAQYHADAERNRADSERVARRYAEARLRELEAELRRLRNA